jgi:hypothetical protein
VAEGAEGERAMNDADLKSLVTRARQCAQPGDTLWDAIFDAEAILRGERSILSREEVEAELTEALKNES